MKLIVKSCSFVFSISMKYSRYINSHSIELDSHLAFYIGECVRVEIAAIHYVTKIYQVVLICHLICQVLSVCFIFLGDQYGECLLSHRIIIMENMQFSKFIQLLEQSGKKTFNHR